MTIQPKLRSDPRLMASSAQMLKDIARSHDSSLQFGHLFEDDTLCSF